MDPSSSIPAAPSAANNSQMAFGTIPGELHARSYWSAEALECGPGSRSVVPNLIFQVNLIKLRFLRPATGSQGPSARRISPESSTAAKEGATAKIDSFVSMAVWTRTHERERGATVQHYLLVSTGSKRTCVEDDRTACSAPSKVMVMVRAHRSHSQRYQCWEVLVLGMIPPATERSARLPDRMSTRIHTGEVPLETI